MNLRFSLNLLWLILINSFLLNAAEAAIPATPVPATRAELKAERQWMQQNLLSRQATLPFSFSYGRESSKAVFHSWHRNVRSNRLDGDRTEHVIVWLDPESGLEVRCRAVEYHDFPTLEWTLYFRNTGSRETPVISDIHAVDVRLIRKWSDEFLLHYNAGDNCSAGSYEPFQKSLTPNTTSTFAPDGGRPTNGRFPYFNVEYDGGGLIAVLGWPGQWSAS